MELSAHGVTHLTVKETLHDNFVVKNIRFIDGDANVVNIKLFGNNRNDLSFMTQEIADARENK